MSKPFLTSRLFPIFRLRQEFERLELADPVAEVSACLARLDLSARTRPGDSVAVAVGSRGIHDLPYIVPAVVRHFQGHGLRPFVVPAMGSHGGATAEGQTTVLQRLGLDETVLGCPIRASMETVELGRLDLAGFPRSRKSPGCPTLSELPILFDRTAFEADHVFPINRIKPHTRFRGPLQSGLLKMLMVGLGNDAGASLYHRVLPEDGFAEVLRHVFDFLVAKIRLLGGLGLVENAFDRTAVLRAVLPEEMPATEEELLRTARRLLPRLPFAAADLLMVDRIGKEISGTGMDTNVIGRKADDHRAGPGEKPSIRLIAVRGLSEATRGNANGIGMAEFCKSSLLPQIDQETTRLNAITANHVTAAMLPLDYASDREILVAAHHALGRPVWEDFRFLWIADTKHLAEIECSASYFDEAQSRGLDILIPPRPLPLDETGQLPEMRNLT